MARRPAEDSFVGQDGFFYCVKKKALEWSLWGDFASNSFCRSSTTV
jgi:hypothetical protein